jgi:ADP-heptose:LPS heptosyltransferase
MFASFYDWLLAKLDNLLERFFRRPEESEAVSFQRHLGDPRKILLVPGDSLIDLVLSSEFITATAARFPKAEVCVLTDPDHVCLLEHLERVRAIGREHRGSHYLESDFRKTTSLLQEEHFDWAVNMSFDSARGETMIVQHCGARVRTGIPTAASSNHYNLLLKNPPSEELYQERMKHLFGMLQVNGPFEPASAVLRPTAEEDEKAALFIRHRRHQSKSGDFIICVPAWRPGQKSLVQNLHGLLTELTRSHDPFNLVIASNLVPENESDKLEPFNAFVHRFNNLRNMVAALKASDRVLTNSTGVACLVSRLGVAAELFGFDREYLTRLDKPDLKGIRLHNSWNPERLAAQPTA